MYRPQQSGPYPMRGLGVYALSGTCDSELATLNQANAVVFAQQDLLSGLSASLDKMTGAEWTAFWANAVEPAQQGLRDANAARESAQTAFNLCQSNKPVDPYVNPNGGGTTPPPAPAPSPSPGPAPAPQPAKLTCPSGQVPSADGKSCVKPATPAASSSNTLLIVGGLALLGVGAFILLRKKK